MKTMNLSDYPLWMGIIAMCLMSCGGRIASSPDLMMYELQGDVSVCEIIYHQLTIENGDTTSVFAGDELFRFSPEGVLDSHSGVDLEYDAQGNLIPNQKIDSIIRNKKGQIIKMVYADKDDSGEPMMFSYWTYDERGYPSTYEYYDMVVEDVRQYTYDDKGLLIKADCEYYNGENDTYSETYKYLQFDEHGNWTKRLRQNAGIYLMQTREITYWSDNVGESVCEEEIIPVTPKPNETRYVPVQVVEDDPGEETIFDVVEEMPEYPGGQAALMEFLKENIQYPATAKENGTQGRVIVQFVVEKDGTISNAKVVRSVEPDVNEEALRVVKSMPRWKPGAQRGKPMRVKFTLPVMFRL